MVKNALNVLYKNSELRILDVGVRSRKGKA